MGRIADKIAQIRSATYGRDVRESIASGLESWDEYNADTLQAIESASALLSGSQSTLNELETAKTQAGSLNTALNTAIADAATAKTDLQAVIDLAQDMSALAQEIQALKAWKASVEAGSTSVLVKQE